MTITGLNIISQAMKDLGLKYAFGSYKAKDGKYPKMYFVGEYQEVPPDTESGEQESQFILTGFTRETWLDLEEAKEKIMNHFNKVSGETVIAKNGTAVAIFYANSFVVPTGDAELKRIEINLTIKEWSVR